MTITCCYWRPLFPLLVLTVEWASELTDRASRNILLQHCVDSQILYRWCCSYDRGTTTFSPTAMNDGGTGRDNYEFSLWFHTHTWAGQTPLPVVKLTSDLLFVPNEMRQCGGYYANIIVEGHCWRAGTDHWPPHRLLIACMHHYWRLITIPLYHPPVGIWLQTDYYYCVLLNGSPDDMVLKIPVTDLTMTTWRPQFGWPNILLLMTPPPYYPSLPDVNPALLVGTIIVGHYSQMTDLSMGRPYSWPPTYYCCLVVGVDPAKHFIWLEFLDSEAILFDSCPAANVGRPRR